MRTPLVSTHGNIITIHDEARKALVINNDDRELITRFLDAKGDYSPEAFAERVLKVTGRESGISGPSIRRLEKARLHDEWPSRLETDTRIVMKAFLTTNYDELVGRAAEESAEEAAASMLPDVSYLKPASRAFYERTTGSWFARRWPLATIQVAARELVAQLRGANTLRKSGQGQKELTDEEQMMVLESAAEDIEEVYGPDGILKQRW